ncbi:MAG: acyltransferase family protein [Kineosporiaceae bacterium]
MTTTAPASRTTQSPVVGSAAHLTRRAPFRADIEGLRAVAVLAVVAFHADVPGISGGFVGVDVFFVLSGFLITDLMLRALVNQGRLGFTDFYARRARRILPLAATVLVVTAAASALLLPPIGVLQMLRDVAASALMLSNWHFVSLQTDYFADTGAESPVLHYWSLAVEEQFYLVWPALIAGLAVLARRRGWSFARVVGAGVLVLSVGSFALAVLWTRTDPTLAYLSTATRVWQFGVGALVALLLPKLQEGVLSGRHRLMPGLVRHSQRAAGWAGLVVLVGSCALLTEAGYPGTLALAPTFATAALILAGMPGPDGSSVRTGVSTVLTLTPLRFVGRISFGLYLWHWPVLVLGAELLGEMSWTTAMALMVGAGLLATVSYFAVEDPVRRSRRLAASWGKSLSVGVLAVLVALVASLAGGSALIWRQTSAVEARPTAALELPDTGDGASTLREGELVMTPFAASTDFPSSPEGCITSWESTVAEPCVFEPGEGPRVVLFGDSHAQQWSEALVPAAEEGDWNLEILSKVFCTPATRTVYADALEADYVACDQWRESALARLTDPATRPDVVIVGALNTAGFAAEEAAKNAQGWETTLDRLRAADVRVVYLRDTPRPAGNVPDCLERQEAAACDLDRIAALPPDATADRIQAGLEPDMAVVDLTPALCGSTYCPVVRDGIIVYRDDSHLTSSITVALSQSMTAALDATGLFAEPAAGS